MREVFRESAQHGSSSFCSRAPPYLCVHKESGFLFEVLRVHRGYLGLSRGQCEFRSGLEEVQEVHLTCFTGVHALGLGDEVVGVSKETLVEKTLALLRRLLEVPARNKLVTFAGLSSLLATIYCNRASCFSHHCIPI